MLNESDGALTAVKINLHSAKWWIVRRSKPTRIGGYNKYLPPVFPGFEITRKWRANHKLPEAPPLSDGCRVRAKTT